ncbi:hypothetical protein B0T25DRAFT_474477 [Lasiosphaeria hispida]|uniref:Rhodopsin domain-containing protein n=1 Tax=Lasiosphaeria hispida TaxID=260671 RepID=A0AAJ0HKW9_9PEZI|nr:hypothetical protein B0T25DRAFT_474477 [Lasiosphaeria hispida]
MATISDNTQLISIFGFPTYNNFDEPRPFTNEPATLIGFTTSFLALSWIFVSLRVFVRLRVVRLPGLDDLFVSLYLIFTSLASVVFLLTIKYGAGRHFLLLTVGDVRKYFVLFYVLNVSLNLAAAFIKLSLLFQFIRMFDKGTWAHRLSVVGIVLVTIWGVAFTFLSIFPCTVISDSWNILSRDSRCWGYASQNPDMFTATLVSHNTLNTFFDLYITLIPFQLYFQPGIALRTRLGLMVLLLMGATVVTLSVWRVHETIYHKAGWLPTRDPTWYGPKSILLMVLEVNTASICASVPIFWPILRPYLGAIFVTREFSVKTETRESSSSHKREDSETGMNSHYKDSLVMDWVDPLGSTFGGLIQGGMTDEKDKSKKSMWHRH